MTGTSDNEARMGPMWLIDDAVAEALTQGDPVDERFAPIADAARHIAATADGPVPEPSAELRALLGRDGPCTLVGGAAPSAPAAGRPGERRHLGRARKVAVAVSLAAGGVVGLTGAAAAGVLPSPLRTAIDTVSPLDLPEPAGAESDRPEPGPTSTSGSTQPGGNSSSTTRRSEDVPTTGPSGGDGRPSPPASGLDRAGETPAAPNLPTSVPVGPPASTPATTHPTSSTTPAATTPASTTPGATAPGATAPGATATARATTTTSPHNPSATAR
jgi:hypothetical protein